MYCTNTTKKREDCPRRIDSRQEPQTDGPELNFFYTHFFSSHALAQRQVVAGGATVHRHYVA